MLTVRPGVCSVIPFADQHYAGCGPLGEFQQRPHGLGTDQPGFIDEQHGALNLLLDPRGQTLRGHRA